MWAINAVDIYFLVVNYDLLEKRICRKHHYQQLIVSLLYKQLDTKCLALVEYWSIGMEKKSFLRPKEILSFTHFDVVSGVIEQMQSNIISGGNSSKIQTSLRCSSTPILREKVWRCFKHILECCRCLYTPCMH